MGNTQAIESPSIHVLPPEMLEEIFRFISTSDMLLRSRLVCQKWSELAKIICHSRQVRVKPWKRLDYGSEIGFHTTFSNPASVRWTACELNFTECPENKSFNVQLFGDFGTQIQALSVSMFSSSCNDFLDALRRTPNLMELDICVHDNQNPDGPAPEAETFIFPQEGEIELLKLKKVRIVNVDSEYDEYFEFLQFIISRAGAKLESLDLPLLNANVLNGWFEKMVELLCIAKIPNLSVGLYYGGEEDDEDFDALLAHQQQFQIHHLKVDFRLDNYAEDELTFDSLHQFLNNSIGLTTLKLGYFYKSIMSTTVSTFFRSLTLPDLDSMALTLRSEDSHRRHEDQIFTLHPLQAASFPKLERIELLYWPSNRESVDIGLIFEPRAFTTVKYLKVEYRWKGNGIRGRFASIFPNITEIQIKIRSVGQIVSILEGMQCVTKLHLELDSKNQNALLNDVIQFIVPLTTLQVLNVDVSKLELSEAGALLFMQLPRLNINIFGSKLKETNPALVRLRRHHYGVQILGEQLK